MSDDLSGPKEKRPHSSASTATGKNSSDEKKHGDGSSDAGRTPPARKPRILMQFSDIWHALVHTVVGSAEFVLTALGALILHGFTHILVHFGLIDGVAWRTLVFAPSLREFIALVGDASVYCMLKVGENFLLLLDLVILVVKTSRQLKK